MSFASLKNRRTVADLQEELNKFKTSAKKNTKEKSRFWSPKPDKNGNASAIIRFLPAPESDDLKVPFVKTYDYGFRGPTGKWFIENSLRTIGKTDIVAYENSKLWNSDLESNKEIVRTRRQRTHFITNIYVIKDTLHPENEGKVFLYQFGKKVWEKIEAAMMPPKEFDEEPIIPYDLWTGANFKLRVRKGDGGWPTYQDSAFDKVGPLFVKKGEADEAKMEEVYNQVQSLLPFIDPNGVNADGERYFKTPEELKVRYYDVMELTESENSNIPHSTSAVRNKIENHRNSVSSDEDSEVDEAEDFSSENSEELDDEDSDVLAYLKNLAEDDD